MTTDWAAPEENDLAGHPLVEPRFDDRPPREITTAGHWETETASAAAFDRAVTDTGLFLVRKEVTGQLIQPLYGQRPRSLRIDRILKPGYDLQTAGFVHGYWGVELKASGLKINAGVAQMLDYRRCQFKVDGGCVIHLSYVYMWPLDKQHGFAASIQAQNRLGSVCTSDSGDLVFWCGEETLLRLAADGTVKIGGGRSGLKAGSR